MTYAQPLEHVKRTWDLPTDAVQFLSLVVGLEVGEEAPSDADREHVKEWVESAETALAMPRELRERLIALGYATEETFAYPDDILAHAAYLSELRERKAKQTAEP